MAAFVSTWFSYFVILSVIAFAYLAYTIKTVNPLRVIGMTLYMQGIPIWIALGAAAFLAILSKYDPLGWLWSDIANWVAWALRENPDVI